MTMNLSGRRAVVTGGSKGAGAAVVTRLRSAGASVSVVARHEPDDADCADIVVDGGTVGAI